MIVDMALQPDMKTEYQWHHAFALVLCGRQYMSTKNNVNDAIRRVFIETELSTIPLCAVHIWKTREVFFVFSIVFAYCRMWKIPFVYLEHVTDIDLWRDIPIAGLFLLNCHWFFQILWKWNIPLDVVRRLVRMTSCFAYFFFLVWGDAFFQFSSMLGLISVMARTFKSSSLVHPVLQSGWWDMASASAVAHICVTTHLESSVDCVMRFMPLLCLFLYYGYELWQEYDSCRRRACQ